MMKPCQLNVPPLLPSKSPISAVAVSEVESPVLVPFTIVAEVPDIVDLQALQNLREKLKNVDLHKLPAELLPCVPSLPNMPDLHKLREDLLQLLSNCLPE
ncbi:hypothetical protein T459_11969 [Capsicum annuum]|uniref:Uncharacterized protein n=1 Tax=Capsicum annuum TaxID=4072 RepID=A0A2G2ZNG2_CAPAN|nr:hypothetical protein T459_11969 [Capsicum annuum]